jgi:tetratricopeptide (TPR) repeat protein
MHKTLLILLSVLLWCADAAAQKSDVRYNNFFLEAMLQRQKGNIDASFDLLRHCIRIDPSKPEAYYFLAQYYTILKDKEKSLQCFKKAAELNPDNETYMETLARAYINNNQFAESIEILEKVVAKDAVRIDILELLAQLYVQVDDKDNAIKTLSRIENIEGKNEQISHMKSEIYREMGNKEASINEMQSLSEQYPYDMSMKARYAQTLFFNEEFDMAMGVIGEIFKEDSTNVFAQQLARDYYFDKGLKEKADSMLYVILNNSKTTTADKVQMIRQEIIFNEQNKRDSTEVIKLFELMMQQPQTDTELALLYVSYMDMKKMPREAMHNVVTKVLEIEPDNSSARMHLVGDAWLAEKFDEVIRLCKDARIYNPEEIKFYYYQGLAYFNKDDFDNALDAFKNGVGAITGESDVEMVSDLYMLMGDLLFKKEMKAEAYEAYDSCLQWRPDNIACLNNYAYFLSIDGKHLDKAEEMSRRTIKKEPENPTYLDTYAWVLFRQKRYAEAKIYIEQALKFDTVDVSADVLEHAGDIYANNGEMEKAMEKWKEASKLAPENKVLIRKIKLKKYLRR